MSGPATKRGGKGRATKSLALAHSLLLFHLPTHSHSHSFTRSLTYSHSHSFTRSPHLLTHSHSLTLAHSLTHSLSHSLTHMNGQGCGLFACRSHNGYGSGSVSPAKIKKALLCNFEIGKNFVICTPYSYIKAFGWTSIRFSSSQV